MGDLRNKFAKIERDEAVRALQARMEAKPPSAPPRCRCGHTAQEKPLWAFSGDRDYAPGYFCLACLPAGLRAWAGLDP